jgi:hypothetical protein
MPYLLQIMNVVHTFLTSHLRNTAPAVFCVLHWSCCYFNNLYKSMVTSAKCLQSRPTVLSFWFPASSSLSSRRLLLLHEPSCSRSSHGSFSLKFQFWCPYQLLPHLSVLFEWSDHWSNFCITVLDSTLCNSNAIPSSFPVSGSQNFFFFVFVCFAF